jgi:hypothetical protein
MGGLHPGNPKLVLAKNSKKLLLNLERRVPEKEKACLWRILCFFFLVEPLAEPSPSPAW